MRPKAERARGRIALSGVDLRPPGWSAALKARSLDCGGGGLRAKCGKVKESGDVDPASARRTPLWPARTGRVRPAGDCRRLNARHAPTPSSGHEPPPSPHAPRAARRRGLGPVGYATAARARNRYYQGPVSDHFDGVRFFSPGQPQDKGLAELLRWQLGGGRADWPDRFPSPFRDRPPARVEGLRVALVGHASLLIQVAGPEHPDRPGLRRAGEPGRPSPARSGSTRRASPSTDLPPIDAVLVTHNHYDHLDVETIARLLAPRPAAHRRAARQRRDHPRARLRTIAVETRDWGAVRRISAPASRRIWSRPITGRRAA